MDQRVEDPNQVWRDIAAEVGVDRPNPGRTVRVVEGRKHKGKSGVVVRHQQDQYSHAFRYGDAHSDMLRDLRGRYGFVVLVRQDDDTTFWVRADYVEVVHPDAV